MRQVLTSLGVVILTACFAGGLAQQEAQQPGQAQLEELRQPIEQLREAVNGLIDQLLAADLTGVQVPVDQEPIEELERLVNAIFAEVIHGEVTTARFRPMTARQRLQRLQTATNDLFAQVLGEEVEEEEVEEVEGLPAEGDIGVTVEVAEHEAHGAYLVDAAGRTLYLFLNDEPHVSNCYDQCAENWPPYVVFEGVPYEGEAADHLEAGEGADTELLGTTTREDGAIQVTYNGWPLYYFAQDENPGDVNGQGVGEVWYLVSPEGEPVGAEVEEAGGNPGYANGQQAGEIVLLVAQEGVAGEEGEAAEAGVTEYELPGDEVYPEGIAYDPATGFFYVGSTTDGAILQGDVATGEVSTFSPGDTDGRTTALGMAVDEQGRLWIAAGGTRQIFVYDTTAGELIQQYETPEAEASLLNDVIISPAGDAYITDSFQPILFRISASPDEVGELEAWLDFTDTVVEYQQGVNLNGIEVTEDGRYLIAVQMNTGQLYRIEIETQEIIEIDLGEERLERGDGLVLDEEMLYVVYNQHPEEINISAVHLTEDFTIGSVVSHFSHPTIARSAATAAQINAHLLVVNAQFDRRAEGDPELPFTIPSIPIELILAEPAAEEVEDEEPTAEEAEDEEPVVEEAEEEEPAVEEVDEEELFAQLMSEGQQVYSSICAACHGGQGQGGIGPQLDGRRMLNNASLVVSTILWGLPAMPEFHNQLSDREVAAVATFVRNSWANEHGLITEEEVREQRR